MQLRMRLAVTLQIGFLAAYVAPPALAAETQPGCTITVNAGESIQSAVSQANAGDVVCIAPGVYHEKVEINNSGTESRPIVIRGVGGRPIIDGGYALPRLNALDLSGDKVGCPGTVRVPTARGGAEERKFQCTGFIPLVGIRGSGVILENLEVTRSTGVGVGATADTRLSNIVIRNVYVHSTRLTGIDLRNVSNVKVEHNDVSDAGNFAPFARPSKTLNWGAAIGSFGVHFAEFRANVVHDNWSDALLVDVNLGKSSDVKVLNNVFYDNFSSNGVYAHAVQNVVIRNNLFYCSDASQVFNWSSVLIAPSERSYSEDIDTRNVVVSNNIFANCARGGIVLWNTKPGSRTIANVQLTRNTFFQMQQKITPYDGNLHDFRAVNIQDNLDLSDGQAGVALAGRNELASTRAFRPGGVDPQWFAAKRYGRKGADVRAFERAGLQ